MSTRAKSNLLILLILLAFISACKYQPYAQGERLYEGYCGNCHAKDGSGLKNLIPSIANSESVQNNIKDLPCIIKNGITNPVKDSISGYSFSMPPTDNLSDAEIANIVNYIIYNFDYKSKFLSEDMVHTNLANCNQ